MFVTYYMWHLMQQDDAPPAIVVDTGALNKLCFLRDGRVLEANSLTDFRPYLRDPSAWCVLHNVHM